MCPSSDIPAKISLRLSLYLLFALSIGLLARIASAANEIAAPTVLSPGQTATLKWYFAGAKLTVSGGQFPPETLITGRQSLKVTPKKTTTYLFDLYYHPDASAEAQQTATSRLVHVQYKVTIEVLSTPLTGVQSYKGTHGWRINYPVGWKPMPYREGNDDLIYFQVEEDAVERLAVSVIPAHGKSVDRLIDEVRSDIPSNYTHYELQSQTEFTHQSLPTLLASFTGNSAAHPDTRTASMLMVVINGDMGYVISARTSSDRLKVRQPILERLMHSFALTGKIVPPAVTVPSAPSSLKILVLDGRYTLVGGDLHYVTESAQGRRVDDIGAVGQASALHALYAVVACGGCGAVAGEDLAFWGAQGHIGQ